MFLLFMVMCLVDLFACLEAFTGRSKPPPHARPKAAAHCPVLGRLAYQIAWRRGASGLSAA